MMTLQTYHNLEQLETGYTDWKELSEKKGLPAPFPIERLDKNGHNRILAYMIRCC
jgi:hypothetical protein